MKIRTAILAVMVVAAAALAYNYFLEPRGRVLSDKDIEALNVPASNGSFNLPQVKWLANSKPDLSGPIEYKVSWGSAYGPAISKIVFAPYDVKPGDTQKLYAVAQDAEGVSSLTASIKTDSGVQSVDFALVQGDAKSGVWQGSWSVKDVHAGYYTATFAISSISGATRSTAAAFTDGLFSSLFGETALAANGAEQCGIPTTGAWSWSGGTTCLLTTSDAVVNGSITISGNLSVLSIPAGITFGFTNGYSITLSPPGSISIASGAQIVKMGIALSGGTYNAYVEDKDGDNYWDAQTVATSNPYGGLNSGIRSSSYLGGGDCYDVQGGAGATSTNPGDTAYFTTANGAGSFDYDCDGSISKNPSTYSYNNGTGGSCPASSCTSGNAGLTSTAPYACATLSSNIANAYQMISNCSLVPAECNALNDNFTIACR